MASWKLARDGCPVHEQTWPLCIVSGSPPHFLAAMLTWTPVPISQPVRNVFLQGLATALNDVHCLFAYISAHYRRSFGSLAIRPWVV